MSAAGEHDKHQKEAAVKITTDASIYLWHYF